MKTNITISLDIEVVEELKKEKNYSGLINSYLKYYYGIKPTEEELNKEIKEVID